MSDNIEITELSTPESFGLEIDRLYSELPAAVKNAFRYKSASIGLLDSDKSQLALDTLTRIHGSYMRKKERSRNAARVKSAKIKALKAVQPIEEEIAEEVAAEEVAAEVVAEVVADESSDESYDADDSEPDNIEKVEPDNLSNIRELLSRSTNNELPQPKKAIMPKRAQRQQVSGSGLLSL
jgi:hypothetical protein